MKKKYNTTQTLLGITQAQMGKLLGISKSQWSMYESGLRPLPPEARPLYANLLKHMQAMGAYRKEAAKPDWSCHKEVLTVLDALLKANQYKQTVINKKIEAVQKKETAHRKAQQVAAFLDGQPTGQELVHKELSKVVTRQLPEDWEAKCAIDLITLDLKLELLQLEKILLESKLRQWRKPLADTEVE